MKTTVAFLGIALFSLLILSVNDAMSQGICPASGQVILGSLDAANGPFQNDRVNRNGVTSTCNSPKPYPGNFTAGQQNYKVNEFAAAESDQCVTVNVEPGSCGANVFVAAYLNSFNPANFAQNYLADPGFTNNISYSFSFIMPQGSNLLIVANSISGPVTCDYSFTINDYPCFNSTKITLAPPTATLHAGEPHTVTATVEENGNPSPGSFVTFKVVSGLNAGKESVPNSGECSANDDCTTDSNGQVSWTYTSYTAGTDTVTASVTLFGDTILQSDPVEVIWLGRPIPTLSEWGLITMAGLAGIVALVALRRKKARA